MAEDSARLGDAIKRGAKALLPPSLLFAGFVALLDMSMAYGPHAVGAVLFVVGPAFIMVTQAWVDQYSTEEMSD